MAREANINLLRVWGGGLREKRAFYDLCDRLGILVWQEFPFACAFLARYPRSPDYLRIVQAEAGAIIRGLRHHPCLAIWCGGNEFSPRRNAPLIDVLETAVAKHDPDRPFVPASPALGDSHNWHVWHHSQPPSAYQHDKPTFASEFGLQAPPDIPTLRCFLSPEDVWPAGTAWAYHGAGLAKLERYAKPFHAGHASTLDSFVKASQRAQAHGLQIAIEHYRRRKAGGCGGMALWQFNEPWPAISWSILDFYRQPKPAYQAVKRLYSPILISADYGLRWFRPGDSFECAIWLINDTSQSYAGCELIVVLADGQGQSLQESTSTLDLPGDSAEIAARVEWQLPAATGWLLCCKLVHCGQTLSINEYDLTVHDPNQPTLKQRLWSWIGQMVTSS
jgi:beta-mannosidase